MLFRSITSENSIENNENNINYTEIKNNTDKNKEIGTSMDLSDGHGMGLEGMRERVESFHGRIVIEQNNGFRIFITIPNTVS